MKKAFKIEVDCANCALKVEDAIRAIDGVNDVKVNFLTQRMTLDAADDRFDAVLKEAEKAGKKVEKDFSILR
ncbi:MAG: cation transporter [Clostridia bacterium]|nr:cation transporter [Clostridia bacterium]